MHPGVSASGRYYELSSQLSPASGHNSNSATGAAHAAEHYCAVHGKPFTKHEKGGKVWYSHKAPDGSWCNEGNGRKAAA